MADKIKLRRDTQANWEAVNPILDEGEIGVITDRNTAKLGDGIHGFNDLQSIHGVPEDWVNVTDFGAKGDGVTDDTIAFQNALNTGKDVFIPQGTFMVSNLAWNYFNNIFGAGMSTILKNEVPNSATFIVKDDATWIRRKISNLKLYGNPSLNNNGIEFNGPPDGPMIIDNIFFSNFDKAIFKNHGNIANVISNCTFETANFHYYAQSDPKMHAGSDYIYSCHFRGAKLASIYFENSIHEGAGLSLENCIIEGNDGFGLFLKDTGSIARVGTSLQSVYFELNAIVPSVMINGVEYIPTDIYLEDSSQVYAFNSFIGSNKLVNSTMITYASTMGSEGNQQLINSRLINNDAHLVNSGNSIIIESLADFAPTSVYATSVFLPIRDKIVHTFSDNLLVNKPFDTSTPWTLTGDYTLTSTQVEDSINHIYSSEFTIPVSGGGVVFPISETLNKYTVVVGNIKVLSGPIEIRWTGALNRSTLSSYECIHNKWVSFAFVKYNNDPITGESLILYNTNETSPATIRMNDFQVLEFDTKAEAIDFINSRTVSDIVI